MTAASTVLAVVLAVLFLATGVSKVLAVASMRERAAHAGFSSSAYRVIGGLEIAAALGQLGGIVWWPVGVAAGIGLVLLMVGAVITHLRTGDGIREWAPAAITGLVVISYLALVVGGSR
ncbi:DoxX family protein [Nocardia beijingensis]|uniref:DoxX family protein n=1 Tax=Nocardia beijingensis TaxID=95162 RepID=UPI001895B6D3|nr:DoxX family protein [Nocardia beijingensis]MBF6469893.1 DoxX family protein [Nocardia beijingensis]